MTFREIFARSAGASAVAPGRVNLIGEHTDYSGGFVLPIAIPQTTRVAIARGGDRPRVASRDVDRDEVHVFTPGAEERTGRWSDYVAGAVAALREEGISLGGFDALVSSDVPVGAGLASSAALTVAFLRAAREAFGFDLDDVAIARVARRAETDFVGAPVGVMDPMAASLGDPHAALFLDTRSLAFERVRLPSSIALVVIDSGIAHGHRTGEYRTRRAECERAARLLGVPELRDVASVPATLPPPLDRRARHVVTENARVLEAVRCLRDADDERLGALLGASHASLRDDFEVTVPEVDRLVAIAQADPAVLGARMTGGGFGGAIVAVARAGEERAASARIAAAYGAGGRVLLPS